MSTATNTTRIRETIAVLGAASRYTEGQIISGFRVGREIALQGFNLATGMTLGVPYAAAIGAKSEGALVIGISPAVSRAEHLERYGRPIEFVDVAIYTGMGLEGRQPILVRSAVGAIVIGGEFGTLAEFSAAWTSGLKVIGVLEGMGGISDMLRDIVAHTESNYGSKIVYDSSPENLVRKICKAVIAESTLHECQDRSNAFGRSVRNTIEAYLISESALVAAEPSR